MNFNVLVIAYVYPTISMAGYYLFICPRSKSGELRVLLIVWRIFLAFCPYINLSNTMLRIVKHVFQASLKKIWETREETDDYPMINMHYGGWDVQLIATLLWIPGFLVYFILYRKV